MVNVRNRDKILLFGLAVIFVALLVFLPFLKEKFLPGVVGDVDQYNPDIKTMMSLLGTSLVFNEKVAADFECSKDRLPTKEKIDENFQAVCENLHSAPYIGLFWKKNDFKKFDFQKAVTNIFLMNRSANKNILLEGNLECFENKEDADQTKMRSVRIDCELKITNGVDENDKKQFYTSYIYSYPVEGVSLKVNQVIVISDDNKELVMAVAKHVYNNVTKIDTREVNVQSLKYENQWFMISSAQASGAGGAGAGDGAGDGAGSCGAGDAAGDAAGCDGTGDGGAGSGGGEGDAASVDPVIISGVVASIFVPDSIVTATPVNAVCASTHYNCAAGRHTATGGVNGSEDATGWTWHCGGSDGGTDATNCSELKSLDPRVVPDPSVVPATDPDLSTIPGVVPDPSVVPATDPDLSTIPGVVPDPSGIPVVAPPNPVVIGVPTLTASSRIVKAGSNVSLTWNLNGQTECSLKGGELGTTYGSISAQTDTISTRVAARTTYTLKCPVGSDAETVEIIPVGFES